MRIDTELDVMNYLKEDPLRSGYGDPNFFEEEEFWQFEGVDPELEFVLSFNSWQNLCIQLIFREYPIKEERLQ